ncbi:MAG: glycerophosphodiester phosphodiesterase [Oscillospiraceae bacterium]|nr:glycerophosphodiester phosphodiesterase [Oscillospiraceae bacterium]
MKNIFAHRGLVSGSFSENSLSAFREAVFMKKGIELDVRITNDGVPVVFHDKTLKRMCGDKRKVSDCTYDEICTLHLLDTEEKIPTLDEVLSLVAGKVPLLIEIKLPKRFLWHHKLEKAMLPLLKKYKGEYLLQSFNKYSMRYMKRKLPKVKCGILSGNNYSEPDGFDFISYRLKGLTPKKMSSLKEKYNEIFLWTGKQLSEAELKKVIAEYRPDGIIN